MSAYLLIRPPQSFAIPVFKPNSVWRPMHSIKTWIVGRAENAPNAVNHASCPEHRKNQAALLVSSAPILFKPPNRRARSVLGYQCRGKQIIPISLSRDPNGDHRIRRFRKSAWRCIHITRAEIIGGARIWRHTELRCSPTHHSEPERQIIDRTIDRWNGNIKPSAKSLTTSG
jgi:hypothetical protein